MGSFILGAKKVIPSSANDIWASGYYDANTLTGIDSNLTANKIKSGVTIFGVNGSVVPGVSTPWIPKDTSVTAVQQAGDDGSYQINVPQYSVSPSGLCVTDNKTGLMWPINPGLATTIGENLSNWGNGIDACGLSTYDGHNDWRMPNISELLSVLDYNAGLYPYNPNYFTPATYGPNGGFYWTSTANYFDNAGTRYAFVVNLNNGTTEWEYSINSTSAGVYPVRYAN